MNKNRKNKALAGVLAASMLVTGTLAWQSFTQTATNETITKGGAIGGRLHDYFSGPNNDVTSTNVQQVFVENYSADSDNPMAGTGDLFARIRISEYLEYGEGAGILSTESGTRDPGITIVRGDKQKQSATPSIDDKTTWDTYLYASKATDGEETTRTYRDLTFGGSTYYLPTFNQINDTSVEGLASDVVGTLAGTSGDRHDQAAYTDYEVYTNGATISGDLQYLDEDKVVQTVSSVDHTVKSTLNSQVLSMEQWEEREPQDRIGAFWVYDEDGWAYWAQPITSQSATGLLLKGLNEVKTIEGQAMYYAVHAEAQIASAGDWGNPSGSTDAEKGMYAEGLSDDGLKVLEFASSYATEFYAQPTASLTAVTGESAAEIAAKKGTDETVTVDGIEYYVLDRQDKVTYIANSLANTTEDSVLLYAKQPVFLPESVGYEHVTNGISDRTAYFHSQDTKQSDWTTSYMRMNVLPAWLDTVSNLSSMSYVTQVTTDGYYTTTTQTVASGAIIPEITYDRAFLLSNSEFNDEYALTGTARGKYTDRVVTYSDGYVTTASYSWLRSAYSSTRVWLTFYSAGEVNGSYGSSNHHSVRPALWVAL